MNFDWLLELWCGMLHAVKPTPLPRNNWFEQKALQNDPDVLGLPVHEPDDQWVW